jgi:aminoglycoside phosphotransferase (APT) family kinase protein
MTPKPGDFSCMAHGDAWLANILYFYDSKGELKDCQFIDFQQSVWSSPALDLINLIVTSAETETKFSNFEHFIKYYHGQLVEALKLLNYSKKIPTHKELYLDILDRSFLGVWHAFAVLPLCMAENLQESSTENLLGEDDVALNYKKKIYNNERYQRHMTDLLTYFDQRGLVELC